MLTVLMHLSCFEVLLASEVCASTVAAQLHTELQSDDAVASLCSQRRLSSCLQDEASFLIGMLVMLAGIAYGLSGLLGADVVP